MENASKALVIAGSVLVSVLLVATGVQVYNVTGKDSAEQAKLAYDKMWEGIDLSEDLNLEAEENCLKAGALFYYDNQEINSKLGKLEFRNTMEPPLPAKTPIDIIDVSEKKNESILAYVYNGWSDDYHVYICQDRPQGVKANKNSANFLNQCIKLWAVNFDNLDTAQVTNMTGMFRGCSILKDIYIKNLDTRSAQKMDQMFMNTSTGKNNDTITIELGDNFIINEGTSTTDITTGTREKIITAISNKMPK